MNQGATELEVPSPSFFNARVRFGLGMVVLVLAIAYMAYMIFENSVVYYYTISEIVEKGPTLQEKVVRVNGNLVPGTFQVEESGSASRFFLTDGSNTLDTLYNGLVVPDLFTNPQSQIVVEGTYKPDGHFAAQTIIVKCPSKYEELA